MLPSLEALADAGLSTPNHAFKYPNSWSHVKFSRLQKNLQQTLFPLARTLKIIRTFFQRSNR